MRVPQIPRQALIIALASLALLVLWQAAALSKLRAAVDRAGGPCVVHATGHGALPSPGFQAANQFEVGGGLISKAGTSLALSGAPDVPADLEAGEHVLGGFEPATPGEPDAEVTGAAVDDPQPEAEPQTDATDAAVDDPQPEAEPQTEAKDETAEDPQLEPEQEPSTDADVDGDQFDGTNAEAEAGAGGGDGPPQIEAVLADMPERSPEELRRRGLPEDSWEVPNLPRWDPAAWSATPLPDPASEQWPNSIAICALMKDEHPDDVVEWLRYHQWLGVDHVFLAENAEEVPGEVVPRLQTFLDDGFLTLSTVPGPKHPLQNRWYNRCSKPDIAGGHSWVAFLDLDEFIVVLDGGIAAQSPDLKSVLASFKGSAGLSLQWVLFGSSGHVERPPGGPLANFHKCTGERSYEMKCVANMYHATHHMLTSDTVHDCTFKVEDGNFQKPPVSLADGEALRFYNNTDMTNPDDDPALGLSRGYSGHLNQDTYNHAITPQTRVVLFHYATRSLADYTERKIGMPAGIYAHMYAKYEEGGVNVNDAAVMREFESANGFDGDAAICGSAVGYAEQCCGGQ